MPAAASLFLSARRNKPCSQQLNLAADSASAPLLLFADEGVRLSPGWDEPLLRTLRPPADIGVVLPVASPAPKGSPEGPPAMPRCFLVRRPVFAEGLGLPEFATAERGLEFPARIAPVKLSGRPVSRSDRRTQDRPSGGD